MFPTILLLFLNMVLLNFPRSSPFSLIRSLGLGLRINRPYLDSRYWTGTSLQLRLMRGIFSNANGGHFKTTVLRNRAEYRLILSQRGRRPSRLKSDDIPRD